MDWIAWDASLETGHAGMDAEHKALAELFNLLRDAIDEGKDRTACAALLEGIIRHAKSHFELEQRMMAQHHYPKTEQHAAEHAMLIGQVLDYRKNFDVDCAASRSELAHFPEVWLAYHILFSDKDLAAFLAREPGCSGQ